MFDKFNAFFFGPLSGDACYIFYLLSVLPLIFSIIIVVFLAIAIFRKKYNLEKSFQIFAILPTLFLSYFTNRILYNMCMKTL